MILFADINISPWLLLPSRPPAYHCVIFNIIRQSQFINQVQVLWQFKWLSRPRQYTIGQYTLGLNTLGQDLHSCHFLDRSGSARLLYFWWHLLT